MRALNLWIDEKDHTSLREASLRERRPMSDIVREAIREWRARHETVTAPQLAPVPVDVPLSVLDLIEAASAVSPPTPIPSPPKVPVETEKSRLVAAYFGVGDPL